MATLTNYQYILNKMENENLPFYRVIDINDKVGGAEIDQNQDPNKTVQDAINQIKETFENIDGTFQVFLYSVTGKEISQGAAKTAKTYRYVLKLTNGNSAIQGIANNNNTGGNNFNLMIDQLRNEQTLKYQLFTMEQEYKRKISDLENEIKILREKDPIMQEGITIMKQIFLKEYGQKPILKAIHGPNAESAKLSAIAGPIEQATTNTMSTEQKEYKDRLNNAIKELIARDDNFLEHLEMLAELSKTNGLIYKGAIDQLKQLFEPS